MNRGVRARVPEGQAPPKKDYFAGTSLDIINVISDLITVPNFIQYSDETRSKLDKNRIFEHAELIRRLRALHPNMAFAKLKLESALKSHANDKGWWKDDLQTKDEWAEVCGKRVRVMLRHFRQSMIKARGRSTHWITLILERKEKSEPKPPPEDEEEDEDGENLPTEARRCKHCIAASVASLVMQAQGPARSSYVVGFVSVLLRACLSSIAISGVWA